MDGCYDPISRNQFGRGLRAADARTAAAECSVEPHSNIGVLAFSLGFTVMMTLDSALG